MAKQQNLSLNPTKISGTCGRLMCCLNFEDKTYKELRKGMPRDNERVEPPGGLAKVVNVDYFNGKINTRAIEKDPETGEEIFAQEIIPYTKEEIRRIGKNAKKKNDDAFEQSIDNDDVPSGDIEEIEELEKLMREF
jgi:cell fate regulator YaaT (PSP1 superfamily)